MNFNPEEIYQIASTIWEAQLELPVELLKIAEIEDRKRSIVVCVQISGAWKGAIVLDCPPQVARHAASIMFAAEPANVTVSDMQDAVAELVNMIGGNFKSLLPETCFLALPEVIEGGNYSIRATGSRRLGQVDFACEGESVSIAILEKLLDEAAAA